MNITTVRAHRGVKLEGLSRYWKRRVAWYGSNHEARRECFRDAFLRDEAVCLWKGWPNGWRSVEVIFDGVRYEGWGLGVAATLRSLEEIMGGAWHRFMRAAFAMEWTRWHKWDAWEKLSRVEATGVGGTN